MMKVIRNAEDGFDWIYRMEGAGWTVPASWGAHGWDLGEWPYQAIALAKSDDCFRVCTYCEGDVEVFRFDTDGQAFEFIDKWATFVWQSVGSGPKDLEVDGGLPLNQAHRGPFAWDRMTESPQSQ